MSNTAKLAPDTDNLLLGKGALYFDRLDASDATTGELDLGNATSFEIQMSQTMKDHLTSRSGIRKVDLSIPIEEKMTVKFVLEEYTQHNLLMALRGDTVGYVVQSAAAGVVVSLTAKRDRWLDTGYRQLTLVAVTHGVTTFTENYDYKVDYTTGRIFPIATGTIYEGEALTVTLSHAAINQPKLNMSQRDVTGFLRFVPNNDQGPWWEVQLWKVTLKCDSGIGFITEDWGKLSFSGDVDEDAENHPSEPYGRMINVKTSTVTS
ncbi:MAG: hypothetical protein PHT59_06470 [Candidatus Omnitrophica bacterium]|nr:hypothetical protein [Candidatus Omnitrophota bacterium]